MNRRLLLLFGLVVVTGLVQFAARPRSPRAEARREPDEPTRLARLLGRWSNRSVPHEPPRSPPPGRPFAKAPVAYVGAVPTEAALRAAVHGTNIVICVLDAARVDHFGAYGYPRDTTPHFDRLAKEAVLFEQHFCQQPETGPSTFSLLTGKYPDTHGVLSNIYTALPRGPRVAPAFTLESALGRAGFATYLLSSNDVAGPQCGAPDDFDYVHVGDGSADQREVTSLPDRFWRALKGRKPFFAYIHVLPPHTPYRPPREFTERYRGKRPPRCWQDGARQSERRDPTGRREPASLSEWANLYDENLRWADSVLGELVEGLRQAGELEHTLLVVTADHGESMREHGYAFHVACPYDEALHIPLLIRFPGARRAAGRLRALTQTIDLVPTLLTLYDVPYPRTEVQGASLVPLLTGRERAAHDHVISRVSGGWWGIPCYSIRDAHTTLLLYYGGKTRALYDVDRDPWQTRNQYARERARAAALEKAFRAYAQQQPRPPRGFLDPREAEPTGAPGPQPKLTERQRKTLRGLGYLE
jgi:arylsulfatase A-like enzyme